MEERRQIWNIFGIWNADKEEKWLEDMAEEGWMLESVGYFSYTFIKDEPAQMCFQFDFSTHKKKDHTEYLSIYAEAGWDYIGTKGSLNYFSKKRRDGEANTIYTDPSSQIDMFRRYIIFLLLLNGPLVYLLLMVGIPIILFLVEMGVAYAVIRILFHIRKIRDTNKPD